MQNLEQSVIRILNIRNDTVGTGFIVADRLAVTCAHVVQAAGSNCDQPIRLQFYRSEDKQTAHVLKEGWSPPAADDVAFLELEELPEGEVPVVLGSALQCRGHPYQTFGFASLADFDSRPISDTLDGIASVRDKRKQPMLQLKGEEIDRGLSGSPVLDTQTNRVVGMVSEYKDNVRTRLAWATSADTLIVLVQEAALLARYPTLQLWPETYGPKELDLYLRYLIETNQWLKLPDGHDVPLERIYVSLRADEMNAIEWKSEHSLYLQDLAAIQREMQIAGTADLYTEFDLIRKAIARHPKVLKLTARDWTRLFSEREQRSLSLAEVVQRHPHVVILGDPGSGKTTLGRWLVLQYARALQADTASTLVRADLTRPDTEVDTQLDLGPPLLPIFLRIAEYAHTRWEKGLGDNRLSLERFIGQQENKKNLPSELSLEAIRAMAQAYLAQGRALVILDGLDEVADPDQRKVVMQEVKRLFQPPLPEITLTQERWTDNRVLLTSRIVGYQFDPLTDLPHYTVEEMDGMAIVAFCRAWMRHAGAIDLAEAVEQATKLKDAIFDHAHPGVQLLAGNPLLLTILAQVYWNNPQRGLPITRVALFQEAERALYQQREEFWDRAGIPPLRLTRALAAVAAYIYTHEPTGFTEEGQVRKQLRRVLSDEEQVEAVLSAAREVSGFLIARGEGVYGFLHRALQEYFVAEHLVSQSEELIERLTALSLDPLWREPVVLAVGLLSQPRNPESHQLRGVFTALLNAPDPAGTFLPRRELLAVAACAECEPRRVPPEVSQCIAENLLAFYAEREERERSSVIRERIRRAFTTLRRSPAAAATEIVLCASIQAPDFGRRFAAVDLMIETQWDSLAIAEALVNTWRTYADPAGSLLVALEEIYSRHSEYFTEAWLPMRQRALAPLWERAKESKEWEAILRILYLTPGADFTPEQVNRDSSLTEHIVGVLKQTSDLEALNRLRQRLLPLAGQPGTAQARDAALILSALGDASWVQTCIQYVGERASLLRPLVAAFTYARARTRVRTRVRARGLTLARTLARDRSRARGLAHTLARDRFRARGPTLARTLAHDLARDRVLARGLARDLARDRVRARALASSRDLARALARALDRASSRDRARALDRASSRDLAHARGLALARALDRTHDHVRHRARDRDLALALDRASSRDRASKIVQLIQLARLNWASDAELVHQLDSVLVSFQALQRTFEHSELIDKVWTEFNTAYAERWLALPRSVPGKSEAVEIQITLEELATLTDDLVSSDDKRRERARKVLRTGRQASALGLPVIEQIAAWREQYTANPQRSTQFEWALKAILHDRADWVRIWMIQASKTEETTSAQMILGAIQSVTSETLEMILQTLPETAPWVKQALLHSMSWLVRLKHIPQKHQSLLRERLLNWLVQEIDPTVRSAMIDVLGHWQEQQAYGTVGMQLLDHLHHTTSDTGESERTALYTALARLAILQRELVKPVRAALLKACPQPAAAAALVRLNIAEASSTIKNALRFQKKAKKRESQQKIGAFLLEKLAGAIPDPVVCLTAILDAGTDDDIWADTYHGALAIAARMHLERCLEQFPNLLKFLLARLERGLEQKNWQTRRMALAAVAACAEVMPTTLQDTAHGRLESMLVKGTTDAESFNSRRFALTALSYLRIVTPAVVPALLAACQDIEEVQQDAIEAAGHFQSIEGDLLSALVPALTGESVSTAYAIIQLLAALGTSAAGEAARLHRPIIEALVDALNHPSSQREVVISDEFKGKLEDALYRALLQVAGWTV